MVKSEEVAAELVTSPDNELRVAAIGVHRGITVQIYASSGEQPGWAMQKNGVRRSAPASAGSGAWRAESKDPQAGARPNIAGRGVSNLPGTFGRTSRAR
ncbi:hypothetical protein P3W85_10030 [Cupriavidus basilensis]|uniref:Uncharacterized protein n=1 Tax=Cupriavidus basilensis TaxID=68895 RepID=A0ABT6AKZ8_9BURK|nr:hypothetical protein [Cupriavidus basilensis]MDF3833282.1 hypothetical protein [Cupriavidus basilensis]